MTYGYDHATPQPILMRVGPYTIAYSDELLEDASYTPEQIAAMHNIARAEPGVTFKAPWALTDPTSKATRQ